MTRGSKKTEVIRSLFRKVFPIKGGAPVRSLIITQDDLQKAIEERNKADGSIGKLSDRNTANFLKDFIRKNSCNDNWPDELKEAGYTARQRYGNGAVFEFVRYRPGDTVPFPDRFDPNEKTPVATVSSLPLPRHARSLGRQDEPWLIQAIVNLRIVETHFATQSQSKIVELIHLQMSVKTQPEIDAIFLATILHDDKTEQKVLITCEAKQYGERILEDQIREQAQRALELESTSKDSISAVIPIAVRVTDIPDAQNVKRKERLERAIQVLEFGLVTSEDFTEKYAKDRLYELDLTPTSQGLYRLAPKVRGIS